MFCQQCGAPLAEGTAFCTECGNPIEAPQAIVGEVGSGATAPTSMASASPVATAPISTAVGYEVPVGANAGGGQPPAPKKGKGAVVAVVASVAVVAVFAVAAVGLVRSGLLPFASAPEAEEPQASASENQSDADLENDASDVPAETEEEAAAPVQDDGKKAPTVSSEKDKADLPAVDAQADDTEKEDPAKEQDASVQKEGEPTVSNKELASKYSQSNRTLHESAASSSARNVVEESPYVLPDSDSRYYSESELEDLSNWELYIARNEIYARLGRTFQNEDLRTYFGAQAWYEGRFTPEEFDSRVQLNDYERKNTTTIRELEEKRGSSYVL